MKRLDLTVLARGTGLALQDALVTIYNTGTTDKANLYSANDVTSAAVANPITTDAYGLPLTATYVPDGVFDLRIDKSGYPTQTIDEVQIYDLEAMAALVGGPLATLTGAADQMPYFSGPGAAAVTTLTPLARAFLSKADNASQQTSLGISAFIQTLLDDADAATALATLGAQPLDADLTAIAALATTAFGRGFLPLADAAAARAYIGAGTGGGDLLAANNLSDLANIATARANLGVAIGVDVQAYDADLDAVAAGNYTANLKPLEAIIVAASDETTALTAGAGKLTFRMPYAFTVTDVRASLVTAQTSGAIFTVDVKEAGVTIFGTALTIDNTEKTSTTAATPAVVSDPNLADDAEMTVDISQVGDGTAKGLKVALIGHRA